MLFSVTCHTKEHYLEMENLFPKFQQMYKINKSQLQYNMRLGIFKAVIMKIIIFWDPIICSLVEVSWYFRGMYCFHLQGRRVNSFTEKMEVESSSGILGKMYQTTLCQIPEASNPDLYHLNNSA